jgi:hypothetical protein
MYRIGQGVLALARTLNNPVNPVILSKKMKQAKQENNLIFS